MQSPDVGYGLGPVVLSKTALLYDGAVSMATQADHLLRRDDQSSQGTANQSKGIGIVSFLAAIVVAVIVFTIQVTVFILLRNKLARIFKPKTYLVPERERTAAPPRSLVALLRTLIRYDEREIINKCGLDAYFFLRYLKTLVVVFIPICLLAIPILLPLNYIDGKGQNVDISDEERKKMDSDQAAAPSGLDTLSWGNLSEDHTSRYAAHLILGILAVIWFCAVAFFELRVYIKVRQDYLTSAEHRLRASATTVLVSAIPKKWLSQEALLGLFDVFPGGVRNIWINRDLTQLLDKISLRDGVHSKLESAETDLIKAAKKAQLKKRRAEEKKQRKKMHLKTLTKKEVEQREQKEDERAQQLAQSGGGTGANDQTNVPHTVDDGVREAQAEIKEHGHETYESDSDQAHAHEARHNAAAAIGKGLKQVSRKGGHGVNDAMTTTNGFLDIGIENTTLSAADEMAGKRSVDSQYPLDPVESASTQPDGRVSTMNNTTRKIAKMDDMYIQEKPKFWQFWKPPVGGYASPVPQGAEAEDYMAHARHHKATAWERIKGSLPFMGPKVEEVSYEPAYSSDCSLEQESEAEWTKYLQAKERPSHHLPLFGLNWMFGMPWITEKVDTIYWCRQELARLNLEIEEDQKHPEHFPLMNSAFIQFNHQSAAHMACQSVAHHLPKQMAPRISEISPKDVNWDNMAINWWRQWIRTFIVVTIAIAMTILWAIPVAFTGALSQSDDLIRKTSWLQKLAENKAIGGVVRGIAGVLPAAILALVLVLVPLILGFLATLKGVKTGVQKSEFVQRYYFVFLFVQVFLVVSIASFFAASINELIHKVSQLSSVNAVLSLLARNLPQAANYFFSYMTLQALSTSSGTLLQTGSLFMWFIWAKMFDTTARHKWARNTNLNSINWGSFFPFYTNFACIGFVYCIIAPLISIFVIVTFSLLWVAQRYAMLYVNRFETDTGGVLYPRAINQTFTGIYFMELCMAGLFFIVQDRNGTNVCTPHGIIMIVAFLLTALYQIVLNRSFSPLLRALPITCEDEAVLRDEAFQRAQDARFGLEDDNDAQDEAEATKEKLSTSSTADQDIEMQSLDGNKDKQGGSGWIHHNPVRNVGTWAKSGGRTVGNLAKDGGQHVKKIKQIGDNTDAAKFRRAQRQKDLDAQRAIGNALYGGVHDDIEDLTPQERDYLTQHAFLHSALRARRPAVWIPRDDLGVSDDEVQRSKAFSKYIWISNEGTALDSKQRVVYGRNPPDFSEVDIINL